MSLLNQLDFINSVDSTFRVLENKKHTYELPKGIQAATWYNQPNQNPNSTTSTQYQLYLNENQIVGDYFIEEVDVSITFPITENNTNNTTRPFATGYFAPRVLPLTNASQSIQIVVNGQPIQVNPQNMLEVIMAFNKEPKYAGHDLPCCSALDAYTDMAPAAAPAFETITGSLTNPLLDYFTSTYGFQPRLAGVQWVSIDNTAMPQGATTNRTLRFLVREPIFTGLTAMTSDDAGGFLSATNVQITRNFVANIGVQMMNWFPPANNLSIAGNNLANVVINSAKVYYQVYTPDAQTKLPPVTFYPYIDYGIQSQTAGPVTATGAIVTINSQTMSLNVVPRAIYCWLAVPDANRTLASSQAPGFQINNVQLSFNGVGGQFSSMSSAIEIYDAFMLKQGFIKTFQETGYVQAVAVANNGLVNIGGFGSVLRIPSEMLAGIDWEKYSVGSQFNANLQIQIMGQNLSSANATPSLFVQVVNDALLMLDGPNSAKLLKTILDPSEVSQVRAAGNYEFTHPALLGGSFFGKIGKFIKGVANKVKPVGKFLVDHRDQIKGLAEGAVKAYKGGRRSRKNSKHGSAMLADGLRRHKRHYRGGALEPSDSENESYSTETSSSSLESMNGGKLISKKDLSKRL